MGVKSHKVFKTFVLPLSSYWEYKKAGLKHPKRRATKATLRVVIWHSLKRYRRYAKPGKGAKASCFGWDRKSAAVEHYGPQLAEVHLVVGYTSAPIIAHELCHAIGELPRKAGRAEDDGKMGEVAAYRMQRLTETIGRELASLGLGFYPAPIDGI